MQIGVIGINHKSSEISLREEVAKIMNSLFGGRYLHFFPKVLLSTCNRCELYFSGDNLAEIHSSVINLIRYHIPHEFEHSLYSFFGIDCFSHLLKVTAGLDSAIFSETEIQGQVKQAYRIGADERLSPELHYLFQKCLNKSKKIRSNMGSKNLAETLYELIYPLENRPLLFVGASQINLKIAKFFREHGGTNLWLTNRTESTGYEIAASERLFWIPWDILASLDRFEIVIFGTKSLSFLLLPGMSLPSLIFDLSLPRNVHPDVETPLFNIDQISTETKSDKLEDLYQNAKEEIFRFKRKRERKLLFQKSA